MRNKIFMLLGILIIFVAVGGYLYFEKTIRQQSDLMGYDILIAKTNIPEGTIVRDANQASRLFTVRRIAQNEAVPSAVHIETVIKEKGGFLWSVLGNFISPHERVIAPGGFDNLLPKKITTNIFENQQVLRSYLSEDITEFKEGERFFAIPVTYITAVGGKVQKDDYVDVWVQYAQGKAEKITGPTRIIKVKDNNNREIRENDATIPAVVIFKLNQQQIALVSQKMAEGTLFLTKWGTTPDRHIKNPISAVQEN